MCGSSLVDRCSREATKALTVPCPAVWRRAVASCRLAACVLSFQPVRHSDHVCKVQDGQRHATDFSLSLWQPIQNSLISAFWDSIGRFVAVAAVRDGCPPWATLRSLVIKRYRTVLIRTAAMRCVMECKSLILKVQAQEQNGTRAKARDYILIQVVAGFSPVYSARMSTGYRGFTVTNH